MARGSKAAETTATLCTNGRDVWPNVWRVCMSRRHFPHCRVLTGYSEDVLVYDLSTVLSGPVGPFPTHAWNALGRTDMTSESVAPLIDDWLRHLLG